MILQLFFIMVCCHALADFALQSNTMANEKNRHGLNQTDLTWCYWLTAHALIHGIIFAALLPIHCAIQYGFVVAVSHWIIDFAKCEKWINQHVDQLLHIVTILGILIHYSIR